MSGGVAFLLAPDGRLMGLSLDDLGDTPIADYTIAGILLLSVFGFVPLVGSVLIVGERLIGWLLTVTVGIALIIWVVVEVGFMGAVNAVFEVPAGVAGVFLAGCGSWGWRHVERNAKR